MANPSLTDATREIARRDRVLAQAIARLCPLRYSPRDPDGPFGALVRAIVYQQLAGQAAQALYTRVRAAVARGHLDDLRSSATPPTDSRSGPATLHLQRPSQPQTV